MRRIITIFTLMTVLGVGHKSFLFAQTDNRPLRIMTWNLENMFWPTDDPLRNDDDFTPEGAYHWTFFRFYSKLNTIAQTFAALPDGQVPDIMCLCEVENDSVMQALTRKSAMRTMYYNYITSHSDDPRGINTAMVYNPLTFHPLIVKDISVGFPTRNILYVKGRTLSDTLHVIVCHLPSQQGGEAARKRRNNVTKRLTALVDSVYLTDRVARIVVTGDFNSGSSSHTTRVIRKHLKHLPHDFRGTYYFQKEWVHLDHFFVSPSINTDTAHVLRLPWLQEKEQPHAPFRTFRGPSYHGGVSDHLPLFIDITHCRQ